MNEDGIRRALEQFGATLEIHETHTWEQVGRCVYCRDCNERLYQGYLPKERRQPKRAFGLPKVPESESARRMRERWGKEE